MTWELGLSTGIAYQHPLLDVLEPIARAGFRALEISTAPHHFDFCDAGLVRFTSCPKGACNEWARSPSEERRARTRSTSPASQKSK